MLVAWSVTLVILDIRGRPVAHERGNAASVTSTRAATRGIRIPDVVGMPASDARARLERAGLKFAKALATVGPPGQVVWTRPAIGHAVREDTPITIFVGVSVERYYHDGSGL
jgi:beta-lactam-binding protein with PASTA domain